MNEQENQLIREATGQGRDFEETEPEETNDSTKTGDEQGEYNSEVEYNRSQFGQAR